MKTQSTAKLVVLAIVVVLLVISSVASAFIIFYHPDNDDPPPFIVDGTTTGDDTTKDTTNKDSESTKDSSTSTQDTTTNDTGKDTTGQQGDPWVPNEDHFNFLVLGHDSVALNTDVLMIVSYNVKAGSLAVMQIPRDTYIETDVSSYKKINSVYPALYVRAKAEGESKPELAALEDFAVILEQNLCINIHYSAIMDLTGFANIVDAVGGVTVDVPFDMVYKDEFQNLDINIKAGEQLLDGELASQFIRFRADYKLADVSRINAQKIFMTAFLKQVKDNISMSVISNIAGEVVEYVKTDIGLQDMIFFAKSALSLDLSNVTMLTLPGSVVNHEGLSYYVLNRNETRNAINEYFNIYNSEITNTIFDRSTVFNNEESSEINYAYHAKSGNVSDNYTGDEIDNGDVNIK